MTVQLPVAIANYFAADKTGRARSIAECFTPDAVVIDERNTYEGSEAIRQWMANASVQYSYTVQPFAVSEDDGRIVVSSHLTGNFPGSPVNLRYVFVIEGKLIARLEIVP